MAMWSRSTMGMKLELVRLMGAEGANVREVCRRFAVSPTTAYRLLARYKAEGEAGLAPRSRRPKHSPSQVPEATEAAVLEVRKRHPAWGGRKIAARLRRTAGAAPAASTITAILRRHEVALGDPARGKPATSRFEHAEPNDLWQADFKGHIALADGRRCHPLTTLDDHSRFSLITAALPDEREEGVRRALTAAFERYGKPLRIAFDNGSPWGAAGQTDGGGGKALTALAVWLIEHDIAVSFSRIRHPQTLGKQERYHRSLKAEALQGPPFASIAAAQRAFDRFRRCYNHERPHEAINMAPPIERYRVSPRRFSPTPTEFEYRPDDLLRRVCDAGRISFRATAWKISSALAGKTIALRPQADGTFKAFFRAKSLRTIDPRSETP